MVEAARAQIEASSRAAGWQRATKSFLLKKVIPSPAWLQIAGAALYAYQATGLQTIMRSTGVLRLFGRLSDLDAITPEAQVPFFFRRIGTTFPAEGETRYRVAFLSGCIANVAFARLNEATIRVLQKNGCEVTVPGSQGCCGALQLHAGLADHARLLAKKNIDAIAVPDFDAILTNAAGCGSTLKEYGELLAEDGAYCQKALAFAQKMQDVTEFLAGIDLNTDMRTLDCTVTYQDSCHLAHGQKIKQAPRTLLKAIPALNFKEMPLADLCCGSAGIYNVAHSDMAMRILKSKMENVNLTRADVIATANPGCMLQLSAGARLFGTKQRIVHVVELLDQAYSKADLISPAPSR
jgi:glycolate oxidase iron-sulfur subunit